MRRNTLGILAIAVLLLGTLFWFRGPEDGSAKPFAASCLRIGVVFLALWLALPQIQALAGAAKRWAFSFFARKTNTENKPSVTTSPVARPRRPRRRSNA